MLCPETAGLHDVETVATVSLCVGRYEKKFHGGSLPFTAAGSCWHLLTILKIPSTVKKDNWQIQQKLRNDSVAPGIFMTLAHTILSKPSMLVSWSQRFQFSSQCSGFKSCEKTITRNIVYYFSLYVQNWHKNSHVEKQGPSIKISCVCVSRTGVRLVSDWSQTGFQQGLEGGCAHSSSAVFCWISGYSFFAFSSRGK